MIPFPTPATAFDAAQLVGWKIADANPYHGPVYHSVVRAQEGQGWLAQISNGRTGTSFRAILLGSDDVEPYLAALERDEALLPHA